MVQFVDPLSTQTTWRTWPNYKARV